MADEEIHNVASDEEGPAPVNRDKRGDTGAIEGEVAARGESEASPEPPVAEPADERRPSPSARVSANASSGRRSVAAGVLGGLIVAALCAVGGYYLFAPKMELVREDASWLAVLDAQAQSQGAALAGLDKRLAALEAANSGNTRAAAAATGAAQRLNADMKGLRADLDAARAEIPGLSTRIAKLESGADRSGGGAPDLSALASRLDKIEAAQASPKSETRIAPEKASASDNAAAIAVVAEALEEKLDSGAPIATELKALERLGVEPAQLTALRTVVNGAPTGHALAESFSDVAPKVLATTSHEERGGVIDRFLAHIRGLVHMRYLKETAGADPSALVSQIEAASRRGDAAGALSAFDKLPEAARQAAVAWAGQAGARHAADAAVQSIREAAIGRLTGGAQP